MKAHEVALYIAIFAASIAFMIFNPVQTAASQVQTAASLVLLWSAAYLLASRTLPQRFGRNDCGGVERWRCAWGIPSQLGILPLLYAVGGSTAELCFLLLFPTYMILDFILAGKVDALIKAHHCVCLCGHVIVVRMLPGEAIPTYFAGAVALEVGGGCANIYDLDRSSRWRVALFAVGMSISNVLALGIAWEWAQLPIAFAPKAATLLMTFGLVLARQKSSIEAAL